jgi:aquaporin Z
MEAFRLLQLRDAAGFYRQASLAESNATADSSEKNGRPLTGSSHLAAHSALVSSPPKPEMSVAALLRFHWPEYLMEAALLGSFMVSACILTVVCESPHSPLRHVLGSALLRRFLNGLFMGLTAIAIIYSPWGKQSGAHINPSTTLTFLRLGKIKPWDALFYICSQFAGATIAVTVVARLLGGELSDAAVSYVVTIPGGHGRLAAAVAELVISAGMMLAVLYCSNHQHLSRYTGIFAGVLVTTYITVESPISGMSMNPARTFGSALPSGIWNSFWLYLTVPPLGMLAAAEFYLWQKGRETIRCCKLHHHNNKRCVFCGAHGGFVP